MDSDRQTSDAPVAIAARNYLAQGMQPLPLEVRGKKPVGKWKHAIEWTDDGLKDAFSSGANIGLRLGTASNNLIDLDFDWPESGQVGSMLFSEFPAFGRGGAPMSHRFVRSEMSKGRTVFQLPARWTKGVGASGLMVLELRGDGHQTMVPPSIHPSGERVEWLDSFNDLPTCSADVLLRRAGLCAFLAVIVRYYPQASGQRDEVCLALAGVLSRTSFCETEIDRFVELVSGLAGDEEAHKRAGKAKSSRGKLACGENVWGLPELCRKLDISELEPTLRKWLGFEGQGANGLPQISINPGERPRMVDDAERALISSGADVFQRYDELVRVVRLDTPSSEGGVGRPIGALLIRPAPAPWLTEQFSRVAHWVRVTDDSVKRADPPAYIASTFLARLGSWRLRALTGVTATPTLRPDGSLLAEPGYDAQTQIYYDPGAAQFPLIPNRPTREQAAAALDVMANPFRDFAFADEASRSVALAAVLTALVRQMFPSAPLFAIDAPAAGTGKSLLAECVGIIASGHRPAMMSQGANLEEDQKRLGSVLMTGDRVLVIDNCDKPVEGDFLCSMLTQSEVQVRILGKSEVVRLPTRCTVIATGNNLVVSGDMSRRVLRCRLDAQVERPDQRQFDFDPREEALAGRASIVCAGLTVLRAFIEAGRPPQTDRIGSFDQWNLVRDALVWLGQADPEETRHDILADDPNRNTLIGLLSLWEKGLGEDWIVIADILNSPHAAEIEEIRRELISATRQKEFNPRSVGRYLAKQVDRIAGGRVLRAEAGSGGVKRYRLERVGASNQPASGKELPF
ncbi:bifunctional DNA primase/polymerase [Maricaulis maris]|jgi:hypothetical protein|uniref:bifunctional DNA primase/polymerase n=1 Tax=Maricaulis maris TaxID=74318 RepID=UPI0026F2523A|nr:bifunctional DNA primase/polymerase [Maricaulis maris]